MPSPALPQHRPVTRRAALLAATATLTGCSLRLEQGSPLPGPEATTPPDVIPLLTVRAHLATIAARAEAAHEALATTTAALHRKQLTRLDAAVIGLGGKVPATAPASTTSSWQTLEAQWLGAELSTIVAISHTSRPLAACVAATGLAAGDAAGRAPSFPSTASYPATGATTTWTGLATAIDALEWVAAREDPAHRDTVPQALDWLYAARAIVETDGTVPATTPPVRIYADATAARRIATTALTGLLSECAHATRSATTTATLTGVLFIWSKSLHELSRLGSPATNELPGLALDH